MFIAHLNFSKKLRIEQSHLLSDNFGLEVR